MEKDRELKERKLHIERWEGAWHIRETKKTNVPGWNMVNKVTKIAVMLLYYLMGRLDIGMPLIQLCEKAAFNLLQVYYLLIDGGKDRIKAV